VVSADQIILAIDSDGSVTNRYLWGPYTDQFLADEQLPSPSGRGVRGEGGGNGNGHGHNKPGEVLWPLTDHLNTVRDLAEYNPETGQTTIANHLTYDAFGQILTRTNPAVTTLFAFTARPFDQDTGLQNNLNRWYDAEVGRWLSEDPIGFARGDTNLRQYCGNNPTNKIDPTGLVTVGVDPLYQPQTWLQRLLGELHLAPYGIAYWKSPAFPNGIVIGTAPLLDSIGDGLPMYGDITLNPQFGGGTISQADLRRAAALAEMYPQLPGETDVQYIIRLLNMAKADLVLQHHFAIGGFRVLRHTGGIGNRAGRFGVSWKSQGGLHHGYDRTARSGGTVAEVAWAFRSLFWTTRVPRSFLGVSSRIAPGRGSQECRADGLGLRRALGG